MKHFTILAILLILFSCSQNDDGSNSEFIVGKWMAIERYEAGLEIELGICDPFTIYEFNSDFSLRTYTINENEIPPNTICGIVPLGLYEWNKIEEDKYEKRRLNGSTLFVTIYQRDGEYLSLENLTLAQKIILKRI